MLTEGQANRIWQKMVEAEVRSLYFADLASRYTKRKQIITGISFFLSSGAAATVVAKLPWWVPVTLSLIVAVASAYSIAVGLDRCIKTLSKLHSEWNRLSADYERLWEHWFDDDAEQVLTELQKRARDASEMGTEMPYNEDSRDKWENLVYSRFNQATVA
jgi:hypothetical protein